MAKHWTDKISLAVKTIEDQTTIVYEMLFFQGSAGDREFHVSARCARDAIVPVLQSVGALLWHRYSTSPRTQSIRARRA